jgi:hypothetical protein
VSLSPWALAFCGALFWSLALAKRHAELQHQQVAGGVHALDRGYLSNDAPVLRSLGVAAGYMAALVLVLYLHSDAVRALYPSPEVLTLTVPIVVYWISWLWLCATRGRIHNDPLLFAFTDRTSLVAAALFALVVASSIAWPW